MSAFTSKATGNHSASGQTTWNETGVPGNGDTETIGAHTITVDTDTTVGHSPAAGDGTAAILLNNSSAIVAIASGQTLICRGDLKKAAASSKVTMAAGSKFKFDATAAGTPSTARYVAGPTDVFYAGALFDITGTSGSRCEVSSVSGAAYGRIASNIQGGLIEAEYCDFIRLGDSSNAAFSIFPWTTGDRFELADCTIDECGKMINEIAWQADAHFILDRVKFTDTTSSNCLEFSASAALTSGTRRIDACAFDKPITMFGPRGVTFTNNYLNDGFTITNTGSWAAFEGNFVRQVANESSAVFDVSDCFILKDNSTGNPHFLGCTYQNDITIDGVVFEFSHSTGGGDCITMGEPGGTGPYLRTITHCITLPNSAGGDSGTLFSALGNAETSIVCNHNTSCAGTQGAAVGETYSGHTGMLASFRSNIFWSATAEGWKLADSGTDETVSDLVTAANCDYNCGYNLGDDYVNLEFSSGTPGANDVDVDPQFIDDTGDLASWDGSLGGAGTIAAALARIAADPTLTASSLLPYIRNCFSPTNALLQNAGHDSVTIGAVEYTAAGSPHNYYVQLQ